MSSIEAIPSLESNGNGHIANSLGHVMLIEKLEESGIAPGSVIETKKGGLYEVISELQFATAEVILRPVGSNTEEVAADAVDLALTARTIDEEIQLPLNWNKAKPKAS